MTPASMVGDWTGAAFAHEACVFDADDMVCSRVLPFVEEGLERGEPVLVVASDEVRGLIAERLGSGCNALASFEDSGAHWAGGGAETLAADHESMAPLIEAGKPWRLVGEPTWLALPGGEVWGRYEAVTNDAFADYPYYRLCLHDRRRLEPNLIHQALRTHPLMWDGTAVTRSPEYQPTEAYLRSVEPSWTMPPQQRQTLTVTRAPEARRFVRSEMEPDAPVARADDVVLAVHELVANALKAAGAADVSHWRANGFDVWEVRDDGLGMHETAAGYAPPRLDATSGRGLWVARSLADEATVRPYGPGTAVRLYFDAAPEA